MSREPGQPFRLAHGGRIDRTRPLRFRFDGRELEGFAGDTLAAALLANGVHRVARSYKFHRPRGIYSAGEEEPCALVELGPDRDWTPNCRATQVVLADGLEARHQLGWPSLRLDFGRWADITHGLWPAGFYNKTFKWPRWKTWEPLVRRLAGLGRAPVQETAQHCAQVNLHCDVLVCGAGVSGLAAALQVARSGLRVVLVEQDRECGGALLAERQDLDDRPGAEWAREVAGEIAATPGCLVLTRTVAAGLYDGPVVTLAQSDAVGGGHDTLWIVRPRRILLATGAIEQGAVFADNDRPGIMLASAVRAYLNRYAVAPGRALGLACNNDSAWQTAFDQVESGLTVAFIADERSEVPEPHWERARAAGIEVLTGTRVSRIRGGGRLRGVELVGFGGQAVGRRDCDLLGVSGGWAPRVHLWRHARGGLRWDQALQCFLPAEPPPAVTACGGLTGIHGLSGCLHDGARAGARLAEELGRRPGRATPPRVTRDGVVATSVPPQRLQPSRRRQWIDLLHDVTLDDAALAVREGFTPVEHFKRYTTTGMAADQGKTGNLNAFVALGALTGRAPEQVGVTTFRPPYSPVSLAALAGTGLGEAYAPRRYLPAHRVHLDWGARMEDYGWQRPDAYPQSGENPADAIAREVLAVRGAVGVFDNSPIGKIEVRGRDAATLLDRCCINDISGLAPGRARYVLMLNENGAIIDDGIVQRLDETAFVVNSSSAHAGMITDWLERWAQCEWSGLDVAIDDSTSQWACYTVAGPRAREVLQALVPGVDISGAALPHLGVMAVRLDGLPARIARVSFSGELSFELSVPAGHGAATLARLGERVRERGGAPYGIEALMTLRLEKGYLHVGTDTDGATSPDDVGWGAIARGKTRDYIGRRSLDRPANRGPGRRQLVGLQPVDPGRALRIGGHFSAGPGAGTDGWITSACFSPTTQGWIGLGLLRDGRSRSGETVAVYDGGERYSVQVAPACFHDPDGARLRG